jgi:hypothetical protein
MRWQILSGAFATASKPALMEYLEKLIKMKKTGTIMAIILFALTGCGEQKPAAGDVITVDVTASYPKKELILQDFMDVEYIPLETTDEFLCQGLVQDIGREFIIVRNRVQDGNIFIFDRKGKAVKRINRKGQGSEEYVTVIRIILDEEAGEMFVCDSYTRKMLVYDLDGNFKRSFKHREDARYETVYPFDRENLICHDNSTRNRGQSFLIVSKQDGSITKDIQIPFEEKRFPWLSAKDDSGMNYALAPGGNHPIVPYLDSWILVEPSADTLYRYFPDHRMTPFIVKRPPVRSLDPEVWLFAGTVTGRYCFLEAVKKEGDAIRQTGLPTTGLVYDKQEKALFRYDAYNDDYSAKEYVYMMSRPVNNKVTTWPLEAHRLVESYGKGQLKGRLKEIAAELDEDSNPVIMLMKDKK